MRLSTVPASDILARLPGLLSRIGATGPADLGEVALLDIEARHPRGVGMVRVSNDDWIGLAYAVPNPDASSWTMEIAVDRDRVAAEMFAATAAAHVARTGVDEITLWIHDPELRIGGTEFALERTLHRMTVSLPLDQVAQWPDGVSVEAFEAQDASEWLRVNNRAFRGHPEQSEWSSADLERRLELAWFDPIGLRMIWLNERLAAFNWTKIHPGVGEVVGEIHVVAVDPDFRGQGLGKAATLEGLNYLHEVCGATRAILYVDDANAVGLRLYQGLGFIADELHRAYRWNASKH